MQRACCLTGCPSWKVATVLTLVGENIIRPKSHSSYHSEYDVTRSLDPGACRVFTTIGGKERWPGEF